MSREEKIPREIVLDVQNANLRCYAGCTVQTIPRTWIRRVDLQAFFNSDLELALVRVDGKAHIEIRRKQQTVKEALV